MLLVKTVDKLDFTEFVYSFFRIYILKQKIRFLTVFRIIFISITAFDISRAIPLNSAKLH